MADLTPKVCIRTIGGPRPGTAMASLGEWPPPGLLLAEGGQYVKVSEATEPPAAQYKWQPGGATASQLTAAITVALRARRMDEVVALLHLLALSDPGAAETISGLITLVGGGAL